MDSFAFQKLVNDILMLEISDLYGLQTESMTENKEFGTYSAFLKLRNNVTLPWHLFADNKCLYIVDDSDGKKRILLNTTGDKKPTLTSSAIEILTKYINESALTLASVITSLVNEEYADENGLGDEDHKSAHYRELYPAVTPFIYDDETLCVSINGGSPVDISTATEKEMSTPLYKLSKTIADIGYMTDSGSFTKIFRILVDNGVMRVVRYTKADPDGKQMLSSAYNTFPLVEKDDTVDPMSGNTIHSVNPSQIADWLSKVVDEFTIADKIGPKDKIEMRDLVRVDYRDVLAKERSSEGFTQWPYAIFAVDPAITTYKSSTFKLGVTMESTANGTEIRYFNSNNNRDICKLTLDTETDADGHVFTYKNSKVLLEYVSDSSMKAGTEKTSTAQMYFSAAKVRVVDFITIASAVSDIGKLAEYITSISYKSSMIETDKAHVIVVTKYVLGDKGVKAECNVRSVKSGSNNKYTLTMNQTTTQVGKLSAKVIILNCAMEHGPTWQFSNYDQSKTSIYEDGKSYLESSGNEADDTFGACIVYNTDALKQYIQVNRKGRIIDTIGETSQSKVDKQIRLQQGSPVSEALLDVSDAFSNTFGEWFIKRHNLQPKNFTGLSRLDKENDFRQMHAEFIPGGNSACGTFSAVMKDGKPVVTCYFPGNVWHRVTLSGNKLSMDFVKWYLFNAVYDNPVYNALERDVNMLVDQEHFSEPSPIPEDLLQLVAGVDNSDDPEFDAE